MPQSREVVILANPYSGTGENKRRVESLEAALAQRGMTTRQCWDLDERARLLADHKVGEKYRCLVSAGGDGSMAGVVNDLRAGGDTTRIAIAMLPLGNENLFAREFGHDKKPDDLAGAIERLETQTIDVGDANGRLFTLMASAGFDSEVVKRVDKWRRETNGNGLKRVNRLSYAPKITSVLTRYRYPPVTLTADGEAVTGVHAFVFNIGQYGGGLRIGAHADPTDGMLDWVVFQRAGLLKLARYGISVFLRGHLNRDDVVHGKASKIELFGKLEHNGKGVPIQADGDPNGRAPVTIRVRPKAMRVVLA